MAQPTPEEKLFAVIQGAGHPPIRGHANALSLGAIGQRLSSLIGPMDLPRLNQGLLIVMVLLILWCAITPLLMWPRLDRLILQARQQLAPFVMPAPLAGMPSLENALALMREQDPFRVGPATVATSTTPEEPLPPATSSAQVALEKLKLVGLSLEPEPTVMVEDTATQQTHVLRTGEAIGPFTIKEISSDRVILQLGTEEFELF